MESSNLDIALMLLGVGMGTVFLILLFIIVFSNLLIRLINRYAPEEVATKSAAKVQKVAEISPKIIAAISTAVNISSGGKLKVSKIEKAK